MYANILFLPFLIFSKILFPKRKFNSFLERISEIGAFRLFQNVFFTIFGSAMIFISFEEIIAGKGHTMTVATGIVILLMLLQRAGGNKVNILICGLLLGFQSKAQEIDKKPKKATFTIGVTVIPELSLQEKKIEADIFPSLVFCMFTEKTNHYLGFNIPDQNVEYTFDYKLRKHFMFSLFLSKEIKRDPEKMIHTQNPNFISLGFAKGLKTFEKSRFIGDISIFVEMRNHFNQDWYPVAGLIIHPQYEIKFKKRKNAPPN